jgi:hypothetical protein
MCQTFNVPVYLLSAATILTELIIAKCMEARFTLMSSDCFENGAMILQTVKLNDFDLLPNRDH